MKEHICHERGKVFIPAAQHKFRIDSKWFCKWTCYNKYKGGKETRKMKIKIKLDEGAKMPTRAHSTDAGLDIYARYTQIVPAKESAKFDTGVHI